MNRSLSVRSRNNDGSSGSGKTSGKQHRFTMASLRGIQQPELSKKLYKLIKAENHAIGAYENAAKQQTAIASQLSDWGEDTGDDAISDISDKLGVLLAEIAEQEDVLAQGLEDSRAVLKQIRNTESSVQPSRDTKIKIQDEIQKLKYKEPTSTKIVQLEQELVRAEAQSLVAEAQLTNITRQKFKEAYDIHTAAIIERAEKQILLAKNARQLLELLDDTPIVPGDAHEPFPNVVASREVLNQAEEDLRNWQSNVQPIRSSAGGLGSHALPGGTVERRSLSPEIGPVPVQHHSEYTHPTSTQEPVHSVEHGVHEDHSISSAPSTTTQSSYPAREEQTLASTTY